MTTFSKETALGLAEVFDVADREMTPGEWRAANGKGSACVRADDPEVACAIYLNVRTVEVDECVERWQRDARSIASLRNHARQASEQLRAAVDLLDEVVRARDALSAAKVEPADGDDRELFIDERVTMLAKERDSLLAEREQLRGEVEKLRTDNDWLREEKWKAESEAEKMRPVYEAAVAWQRITERPVAVKRSVSRALWDAVLASLPSDEGSGE